MKKYREFTLKQQLIFYTLNIMIIAGCVYLDLRHNDESPNIVANKQTVYALAQNLQKGSRLP